MFVSGSVGVLVLRWQAVGVWGQSFSLATVKRALGVVCPPYDLCIQLHGVAGVSVPLCPPAWVFFCARVPLGYRSPLVKCLLLCPMCC